MHAYDRYRTGDHALVRQINLSVLLHHLAERGPMSRAALAELTGLNKTTVSSLIRELVDYQFVHEIGSESAGTGRPAVLLQLNPIGGAIISAEIGVDFISIIRTNFAVEVEWRHREPTDPAQGQTAILQRTLDCLREAVAAARADHASLLGLAVGVPGLVDQESGDLLFAPNLKWNHVPLKRLLASQFDLPIFVNNEANMAALGEHFFGAAQGYEEVLYISAGVGLGGGIVRGGRLFGGGSGYAGEFGHMVVDLQGEPCNCGNRGCWETMVSQGALFRTIRQAVARGESTALLQSTGGNPDHLTMPLVIAEAEAGDAVAKAALTQIGRSLGVGLASLVNVLNPELVVFGGILSLASDFLLPVIAAELRQRALPGLSDSVRLVRAANGLDACVLGGVATVYQAVLTRPSEMVRWQIANG